MHIHCVSKVYDTSFFENAEIAQLVEHNLAKVGVAGPSPVFRSLVIVTTRSDALIAQDKLL